MGEIIEATRNIFIDTEQYHTQKDLVNILLPNNDFSVTKKSFSEINANPHGMSMPSITIS